jgi:hypothetical protein
VGLKVTFTVQEAFAAIDVPQLSVPEKSPVTVMPETVAAAVPVLVTVTVCALLAVLSAWVGYDRDVGLADKVAFEEPPSLGNTSKSDNWAAFHPVLAVMFTRTYLAVAALNVMVTVLLLAFGSKVYPADALIVEKLEPSVDPCTDSVCVRADHAVAGGSLSTTLPTP